MHYVGRVDWSLVEGPQAPTATASGLGRSILVGPDQGAVHTELAVGGFAPGGWLRRHVHSFEEALYVLEGELLLELDGRTHRLGPADYALIPIGVWHALGNASSQPVRWLGVNTPQRLSADAGRRDTFFAPEPMDLDRMAQLAAAPPLGDPTSRWLGHYEGTPPQADALRVSDPARGRKPAGMDTALLAYSGISVKMLVDRSLGADMLTMFTVDYEIGGAAQAHDHPFEETYFFLAGETEAELDGTTRVLRAGDVVFAGVGSVHGFYNVGPERVRWIETQAPQPPARHAYRWVDSWRRFEERLSGSGAG
ncbi:MAG TPA: cupin domain-containing protein [Candidatus Limnocylindria bacterium]|nr:cupin domain-containing protein [Candidatus Limnocylindria bacterium]